MIATGAEDTSNAEYYDFCWFDEQRTGEMMALPPVTNMLKLLVNDGPVLDVGCGVGRYFDCWPGVVIHGTELSPKARKVAARRAEVFDYNFEELPTPLDSDRYQLVHAGQILEHLHKPAEFVQELWRVTRPGGLVVLHTPVEDAIPCPGHLWYFCKGDLERFFEKFAQMGLYRFCIDRTPRWEHFLVIARK